MPVPKRLLQTAAIVSSVTLAGCFIYYRAVSDNPKPSGDQHRTMFAGTKSGRAITTLPAQRTTAPSAGAADASLDHPILFSGSKSGAIVQPQTFQLNGAAQQQPARRTILPGSKGGILVPNSPTISNTVAPDHPALVPPSLSPAITFATTQPVQRSVIMSSSKVSVDVIRVQPTIFGGLVNNPATQPQAVPSPQPAPPPQQQEARP